MYQIDQSGKIEQTEKDTVIACSNSNQRAIIIPRKLKRKIQEAFRRHGFTSLFIYFLFSVGVFYLISNLKKKTNITIDIEYPGKDKIILGFIIQLLKKSGKPSHEFKFARIGNRPRVHYAAKDVYDKKRRPDVTLTERHVAQALKKTDGRLRECLTTLVGAQARSYTRRLPKNRSKVN